VLLFEACYGGNITIIGSTANLILIGTLEKAKRTSIIFEYWFKMGFIIGLITLALSKAG
jgi:Na+/H+ antiporter NhaD/arsenite permease-like protein